MIASPTRAFRLLLALGVLAGTCLATPGAVERYLELESKGEVVDVEALKVPGSVTVVFFASRHCEPCDFFRPFLRQLADAATTVAIKKVDVDRPGAQQVDYESPISRHYGLKVLPEALVFDSTGREVARSDRALGFLEYHFARMPPPEQGEGPFPRDALPAGGVAEITRGNQVALKEYLVSGKVTVVDFYSPFCGPCQEFAPMLEKIANQRQDLVVRTVNINRPGAWGIDWMSPVALQYGIRGVPYMEIYGPDGKLQAKGGRALQTVMELAQGGP